MSKCHNKKRRWTPLRENDITHNPITSVQLAETTENGADDQTTVGKPLQKDTQTAKVLVALNDVVYKP